MRNRTKRYVDPDLIEKRDTLVERLEKGDAIIAKAKVEGTDVTTWEDAWITLLREYEAVSDEIREAQS